MRSLLLVSVVVCLVLPSVALGFEQIVPFGYSYYTTPEGVGTVTTVVGFLDPPVGFDYPFTVDFVNNEYTFYFETTILAVTPGPVSTEYAYATTTLEIYEDPSMNGMHGTSPPNASAPSTFTDGTLILSGTLSGLVRLDWNFGFPEPSAVASVDWTGGSKLGEVSPLLNGWTFHAGISANPLTGIPAGYQQSWACKIVPPTVAVEESSWGKIKAIYAVD